VNFVLQLSEEVIRQSDGLAVWLGCQLRRGGVELSRQDKIVHMALKKQDSSALAGSPIDFVSVTGAVRVPEY
jgi:hypothetical protein